MVKIRMNAEEALIEKLQKMDWGHDLSPLVDFLNSPIESTEMQKFAVLRNDMAGILQAFRSAHTFSEGTVEYIEQELEKKLQSAFNEVKIIDLVAGKIKVNLKVEGVIENIWADFICIFLYRDWRGKLAQCGHCDIWFERSRKDKMWCSENCRSKAAYARHGDERRSARRVRYVKQKAM